MKERIALWLTVLSFLLLTNYASAATINVQGSCSLINAIQSANADRTIGQCRAGRGADAIALQTKSRHVLTRAFNTLWSYSGLPVINSEILILGNGSIILRDPKAPKFRIFTVGNSGQLTLRRIIIRGGHLVSTIEKYTGSGAGILNTGVLTVVGSTVIRNKSDSGAAIYNEGQLSMSHSTVEFNRNIGPGAAIESENASIHNSTISNNSGVGLVNKGYAQLTNTTITGNLSYGISNVGGLSLIRCLISGNRTVKPEPEIFHSIHTGGYVSVDQYNLFGRDGNAGVEGFEPGPTDIVPTETISEILHERLTKDNGGFTATHALPINSPALDAVIDGSCPPPATDQRGITRAQDGNGDGGVACDIGSVEMVLEG